MADARTEQTRHRIIEAAGQTIAEVGLERVRMRMVAERAEVSTALLHYHFATREKLFLEALKYSFEHAGEADLQAEPPANSPHREHPHTWMLARVVDACLPSTPELRRDFLLWQEMWLRAARDLDSRLVAVDLYRQLREWVQGVIRDGVAAGEFARCDVARVADLILATTDGFGTRLVLDDPIMSLAAARQAIWSIVSPELGITTPFPTPAIGADRRRADAAVPTTGAPRRR